MDITLRIGVFHNLAGNNCDVISQMKKCDIIKFEDLKSFIQLDLENIDFIMTSLCNFKCSGKLCSSCLMFMPITELNNKKMVGFGKIECYQCEENVYEKIIDRMIQLKSANQSILNFTNSLSNRCQLVIKYLINNPFVKAQKIYTELGISKSYFSKIIRKELGISFRTLRKITRVHSLLRMVAEEKKIKVIADELNYDTPSHMYRDVYEVLGVKLHNIIKKPSPEYFQIIARYLNNYKKQTPFVNR